MNEECYSHGYSRGCIYYVNRVAVTGSEMVAGRPAIIVSNDMCNTYSPTIEVVYLTTQPKNDLPTHVTIRSATKPSTAICEQIHTVDTSRIGDYIGTCTEREMSAIDAALMISLGIDNRGNEPKVVEKEVIVHSCDYELAAARAQIDQLNAMYNNLLEKFIGR